MGNSDSLSQIHPVRRTIRRISEHFRNSVRRQWMKWLSFASAVTVLPTIGSTLADAQVRSVTGRSSLNPSMSLSSPTSNPLQAQMRENYATQLRQDQSQLLQQNPSGMTRQEIAIGQELNGYVAPR